jgi:hypothetical protein
MVEPPNPADVTEAEKVLRGEQNYTGTFVDGDDENFIDDERYGSTLRDIIPEGVPPEERERILHRLETCARAREESTRIMSFRFAQRDAVKEDTQRAAETYRRELLSSKYDREQRWVRKTTRSPFAVDLVAEDQRIEEENKVRTEIAQRKQKLLAVRHNEAHNAIFKRAVAESDELEVLRREKRVLLQNERQLKAMRDVERTNARTAQILAQKEKQQQERLDRLEVEAEERAAKIAASRKIQ